MSADGKLMPGELVIRPMRAEAESDLTNFYVLLEALRGPDRLPLRKLAEISGDTSLNPEPNTLRKIKSRTLTEDARRLILRHIFDDEQLLSGTSRKRVSSINDALYFAVLNYFGVRESTQDQARAQLTGTYKFWRYCCEQEGEFILCKMTCFEDPEIGALRVNILVRKNRGGSAGWINRQFSGYLFCLQQMYLMVSRRHASEDVRITLIPNFQTDLIGTEIHPRSVFSGKREHVTHMDGMTIGINRRNCYISPAHYALVDDVDDLVTLDGMLDIMAESDPRMPQNVVTRLRQQGPLRWL